MFPIHLCGLGTYEEINGIKTYVATPKTDYPKDKAVLYLTDVFGHELLNNRARYPFRPPSPFSLLIGALSSSPTTLLAMDSRSMSQSSSRAIQSPKMLSTLCVIPLPTSFPIHSLRVHQESKFDLMKWLPKHTPEHTGKRVRKVIDGLKEQGIVVYGATGYCYGGTTSVHGWRRTMLRPITW